MYIDVSLFGTLVTVTSLVLCVTLGFLASKRRRSVPGWAIVGLVPGLNVLGWLLLLLTPLPRAAAESRESR